MLIFQHWNNGENHLIFNLYAGTWPDYNETELGFDYGKAILVKASMSLDQFRPLFDISLPLFHPSHPEKGDDLGTAFSNEFPAKKKHLIAFKGCSLLPIYYYHRIILIGNYLTFYLIRKEVRVWDWFGN